MASPASSSPESESVEAAAAQWLARRDRGLTPAEQDEYLQWLGQDPQHGAAMARLDATWSRLDALAEWRPEHSSEPNPHLLDPGRHSRRFGPPWFWGVLSAAMAAAAVVVFMTRVNRPPAPTLLPPPATVGIVRLEPRHLTLPDGSVVRLNSGATVEEAFVPQERRVVLVQGEAHFNVAKDAARPFIVDAGGVTVRAVGTSFNVIRGPEQVTVLVTEGKVSVDRRENGDATASGNESILVRGQRVVVSTAGPASRPVVTTATREEIEHDLEWQSLRLEFAELPLATVVKEFNLHNDRQLLIGDASAGALRVGGTFRADNVDAFVRLLEAGFRVTATEREDGAVVLTSSR